MKFICKSCPAEFKQLKELIEHYDIFHAKKKNATESQNSVEVSHEVKGKEAHELHERSPYPSA